MTYGREHSKHWLEGIRLQVAVAAGDGASAAASLAYMRLHQNDAIDAYEEALVRGNLLNEAARVLVDRLHDPYRRNQALLEVQRYRDDPCPTPQAEFPRRWRKLLCRPDARDAIDRVGRILEVPLPSPE